jgi:hypothetical protein
MAKKKKKYNKKPKKLKRRGMPGRKVAIVGKGEGRGLAPRAPTPGVDVWGTNNVALQQPCDMIFDMHDLDWTWEQNYENYSHLDLTEEERKDRTNLRQRGFENLKQMAIDTGTPIMSVKQYAGVPSLAYPLQQIIKKYDCDMFSSVTPYMIAYAIYKKYRQIDLYGINCAHGEEWAYQREAVSGWLMFAKGQGIKVTVSAGIARPLRLLNPTTLYGFNIEQAERGVQTTDSWHEPVGARKYQISDDEIDPDDPTKDMVKREFTVWKES